MARCWEHRPPRPDHGLPLAMTPAPSATVPDSPAIYHIVHVDRLESIVHAGYLWSDVEVSRRQAPGTTIGLAEIKKRRRKNQIRSRPGLLVGECVPFYFCPRSVMLYVIHRGNAPDLSYHDGQDPIVHLRADLRETADWADTQGLRWAFTLSNAGAGHFEDRCDLADLDQINWPAVRAQQWSDVPTKDGKQAEFLVESRVPWCLIREIGSRTKQTVAQVDVATRSATHRPQITVKKDWYY